MMLIVHVCSLWYSHSVKVNYCFIVLGICYHFAKNERAMCGCIALCWTIMGYDRRKWSRSCCLSYQGFGLFFAVPAG